MDKKKYENVAVLIPCLNEEKTIGKVVTDFRTVLPGARIYVFDNNSSDNTSEAAKKNGATVISSPRRGKGNVIKDMFRKIQSDIYLLVDGDDTYPVEAAPRLIEEVEANGIDMVVGARMSSYTEKSFRTFHKFGNKMISALISMLFSVKISDVLSGYRAFSSNIVKSIPVLSSRFEIETELTLQTLTKGFSIKEVVIEYGERPEGSVSKLNTFSDGFLILKAILMIFKDYRPLYFFSFLSIFFLLLSLMAGILPILDYIYMQYVYHVPLAVLAAGNAIIAALFAGIGIILDTVAKYQKENYELFKRLLNK